MALAPAQFVVLHAVLQIPEMIRRDPAADEKFIVAVRDQFPNVISRQYLPPETPLQVPHLTLASTSSQLAVSAIQVDFEVRFYGDYLDDVNRGLDYVETKLDAILSGIHALGASPSIVGLVGTLRFSFKDTGASPVEHILRNHLRISVPIEEVQDAQAKVALKVRDTYFVNLALANYESRIFERPINPAMGPIRIRPWEGKADDYGLELSIDINNALEARTKEADPVVTETGVASVLSLLRDVAVDVGPAFAEKAELSASDLTVGSKS